MKNPKFIVNTATGNYFTFAGKNENQGYYLLTEDLKIRRTMIWYYSFEALKAMTDSFKRCSIFPVKVPKECVVLSYERLYASFLSLSNRKNIRKIKNFRIFLKTCISQNTVPLIVFYNDEFKLYCDVYTKRNLYYENKQV